MIDIFSECFRSVSNEDPRLKSAVVVFIGPDDAGKSTIVAILMKEPLELVAPTSGFVSKTCVFNHCSITMYDLGGGPSIRGIWKNYYAECHGLVFVLDASNPSRLTENRTLLQDLAKQKYLAGKPVLLLANKMDRIHALSEAELADALGVKGLREMLGPGMLQMICCSATAMHDSSAINLKKGILWLLQCIDENLEAISIKIEADSKLQAEKRSEEECQRAERVRKIREAREKAAAEQDEAQVADGGRPCPKDSPNLNPWKPIGSLVKQNSSVDEVRSVEVASPINSAKRTGRGVRRVAPYDGPPDSASKEHVIADSGPGLST